MCSEVLNTEVLSDNLGLTGMCACNIQSPTVLRFSLIVHVATRQRDNYHGNSASLLVVRFGHYAMIVEQRKWGNRDGIQ
jgi:hypothetical protein